MKGIKDNDTPLKGKHLKYYLKWKHKQQPKHIQNYILRKYGGIACFDGIYIPPYWAYG